MGANTTIIKRRIRSIDSTKKITNAMQLISSIKLTQEKAKMEGNRLYASYVSGVIKQVVSSMISEGYDMEYPDVKKELCIVFTSDTGLCGPYNSNLNRIIKEVSNNPDIDLIVIGSKGKDYCRVRDIKIKESYPNLSGTYEEIEAIARKAYNEYEEETYGKIKVLYTSFINAITFEPKEIILLPLEVKEVEESQTILEPDGEEMILACMLWYMKSQLFALSLEAKTSEQASRRIAMEQATDNAQELQEELELTFNQARQAAITQEISEIVSGANA